MNNFSKALDALKEGKKVRRTIIKNDDWIVNYKKRLYWLNKPTGIRYPYHPSDKDLMANDWEINNDTSEWVLVMYVGGVPHYLTINSNKDGGYYFHCDYDLAVKFNSENEALNFDIPKAQMTMCIAEEHSY